MEGGQKLAWTGQGSYWPGHIGFMVHAPRRVLQETRAVGAVNALCHPSSCTSYQYHPATSNTGSMYAFYTCVHVYES